jgi:hypothetical protein
VEHDASGVDYAAERGFEQGVYGMVDGGLDGLRGLFAAEQGGAGVVENAPYFVYQAGPEGV